MKTKLKLIIPCAICLLLSGISSSAEEDIAALQYKLRSLQNLQSKGRYVNPAEIKRLKDQVKRRSDEIKKTTLRSEAIKDAQMPPDELESLKKKASDFIKDNAYTFIKDKVDERKAELAEKIKKAKNAREVAEYIENYTYSKDAPKNNPGLSKFYNDVYQEQGWIKRNLDSGIAKKQRELDNLSRFDSIDQGLQKAQDLKEQAEKKLDEYQQIIEGKIKNKTGLDIDALKEKAGKYGKYYQQAKDMYNYVNDLKGRADAAGESVPDIPEAAKQGLRNMVYIGEALDKAAGKAPPGVSDMLEFYSNATKVSVKAAENAQKFKLGHGEINSSNQLLSPYNDTLKQIGVDHASMTEFGKATGLRVIQSEDGGYYVVDDDYNIINKKGLSKEQFENMQNLYAGFEAVRKDGEKPLSPKEIAEALAQAENGKKVIIRGEDYGEKGQWLEWAQENAVEREMRKEAAGDLYEDIADDIPPSLWERLAGRDDDEYKRDLDRLVSRWSDYETDKLGDSREELKEKIQAGLKAGKSFDDIMQDLNGELEERKAREEEELRQKEAEDDEEESLDDDADGKDDSETSDESDSEDEDAEGMGDDGDDDASEDDGESDSDEDGENSDNDDSTENDNGNEDSEDLDETDQQSGDETADDLDEDDSTDEGDGSQPGGDDDGVKSPDDQDDEEKDASEDDGESDSDADEDNEASDGEGEDDSAQKDDGLIHGPPSDHEGDAYEEGSRVIDDDGIEYEKQPDGSWTKTGDEYEPLTQEQKDAWDRELEDDDRNLKDQEASSGGSFDGSDDSSDSDGNILDIYADNYQAGQKKKNDISADNMDLNQQIKSSSTSGDQQIYDAKNIVSSAGRDAKDIKDASSSKTAQKDRDDSWGNTLGDAVSDGIKKGLDDFASTFGSDAADAAASQIFDGGNKKPTPSGGAVGGSSSVSGGAGGAVPQPGGGSVTSGGGGGVKAGGGQGGSGAGGGGAVANGDGSSGGAGGSKSGQNDDFDKSGDSVTVKQDAAAGDGGGGTANAGSSASGGFAKGHQNRVINGSGALAGKKVTGVTVKLSYQAYGIPDAFAIIYEGKKLGGSGMTSGRGTISGKGAGTSSAVTIRVLSNQTNTGTQWNWSAEVTFHTK